MYACTLPLVAGLTSESRVIDGHIQNISCSGLCLLARQRLKISELLLGEIGFPGTRASVPTLLQVRWFRKNSFGECYRTGLRFVVQAGIVAELRAGQNRHGSRCLGQGHSRSVRQPLTPVCQIGSNCRCNWFPCVGLGQG
jgi:hypothetical protein